jgi:hypothetical protein
MSWPHPLTTRTFRPLTYLLAFADELCGDWMVRPFGLVFDWLGGTRVNGSLLGCAARLGSRIGRDIFLLLPHNDVANMITIFRTGLRTPRLPALAREDGLFEQLLVSFDTYLVIIDFDDIDK